MRFQTSRSQEDLVIFPIPFDRGCGSTPHSMLLDSANQSLRDALAKLGEKSRVVPDTQGDLGIDHVIEADDGVKGATSNLIRATTDSLLKYYTAETGKVVSPADIKQLIADPAGFEKAKNDLLSNYAGDDAKDVAAAVDTLQIQTDVDQAEGAAPDKNAAAVAGLTQLVKSLQGLDPRARAIAALSAPMREVMGQVGQLSPYAKAPATAAQRGEAEKQLLLLAKQIAPADDAARTDAKPRTSTESVLNGIENDLIGIDRTIEPNNENSSIVAQFWNQHEQQVGATDDAFMLF